MVGAVLLALAVLAAVGSAAVSDQGARLVGGNVPVNTDATDPLVVTAENSPTLVADPTNASHLVIAHRVDLPTTSCGVEASFDAGATWSPASVAFPPNESLPCFAPDIAFDGAGRLHLAFTTFGPVTGQGTAPDAVWLASSDDGGRSFGSPAKAAGPLAFHLRLASDRSAPRRLYLTWVQVGETTGHGFAGTDNPLVVSRSDDAGATWAAPVRVSPAGRTGVVAPSLATTTGGELYVAYLDVGDDRLDYAGAHEGMGGPPYAGRWSLVVARSADHGATWRETVADVGVVPTERFVQLHPPTPALAADGHRVFVAFTDGRAGDPDVWLWRSTDSGRTFAAGRRVNDTPKGDGRSQYLPALALAPDGRLDVVYYDRRADPQDVANEVSVQSSTDGGRTFTAHVRVTDRPFDSRIGANRAQGLPDLGSRLAALATDRAGLFVWADTRAGDENVAKQLLGRAVVAAPRPSPARTPLRVAGAGMALGGATVCGVALLRRRRRRGAPGL